MGKQILRTTKNFQKSFPSASDWELIREHYACARRLALRLFESLLVGREDVQMQFRSLSRVLGSKSKRQRSRQML